MTVGRYGSVSHRLVLYPPGISAQQRRRVRLWRGWMVLGVVGVLVEFTALAEAGASKLEIIAACSVFYALGTVFVARSAGPVRRRVVELTAATSALAPDARRTADSGYVARLARTLASADESLDRGTTSPADHELAWSAVYGDAQRYLSGSAR